MTEDNLPAKLEDMPEDVLRVYEYLPELISEDVTVKDISKKLAIMPARVQEITDNFIGELWRNSGDAHIQALVERLGENARVRFLVQAFKSTKKFGVLWDGCLSNVEYLDKLLKAKIEDAWKAHQADDDEVTIKEIRDLIGISGRHQKQVTELMKSSPLMQNVVQGQVGGLNVQINNSVPGPNDEFKPQTIEVTVGGYIEPPKRDPDDSL